MKIRMKVVKELAVKMERIVNTNIITKNIVWSFFPPVIFKLFILLSPNKTPRGRQGSSHYRQRSEESVLDHTARE